MKLLYSLLCALATAAGLRMAEQLFAARQTVLTESTNRMPAGSAVPESHLVHQHSESTDSESRQESVGRSTVGPMETAAVQRIAAEPQAVAESPASVDPQLVQASVQPQRHAAPLHDQMVTPGNFHYLGAFRLPHVQLNGTSFAYGGWALAWRADESRAAGNGEVLPGSLYIVGHRNDQQVAEITIPRPVISRLQTLDQLPVAEVLQPFADITGGLLRKWNALSDTPFHIGGLLVVDDKLHWTIHKYYNVEGVDYPSHGTALLDFATSIPDGPWHLGPMNSGQPEWHSYKHAGYIFEIPQPDAEQWFGTDRLISGLQISTGLQFSSQGPAMFAYQLPPEATPAGTSLPAIPLTWYSEQLPLAQHTPADRWTGAAWLTLGSRQAVVVVGRKGLGRVYYGEARAGDCSQDKGYHASPYEVQMLFYSPASLIRSAHGQMSAHGLDPWLRWDGQCPGGGLSRYLFRTCSQEVGGMAYDREHNLLYIVQINAGYTSDNEFEALPVIHVFRITE